MPKTRPTMPMAFRPSSQAKSSQRILLVQTGFLGDTILTTPVIAGIRSLFPGCALYMMTTPLSRCLVADDPLLAGVIVFDKRGRHSGVKGMAAMARRLRSMRFERVYAVHRSYRTAVLLWMARIPIRIGFAQAGGARLYHRRCSRNLKSHEVLRNLQILEQDAPLSRLNTDLRLFSPLERVIGEHRPGAPLVREAARPAPVVLVPGSAWETKRWDWNGYRCLAGYLSAKGFRVLLLGAASDRIVTSKVSRDLDVVDLAGRTTIGQALALIRAAALVVCNDSMALHAAAAFKVPTVALFCATAPQQGFFPWGNRAVVLEARLPCRPCGRHGGRKCPNGTEACIKGITPEAVIAAASRLLGLRSQPLADISATRTTHDGQRHEHLCG